MTLALFFEVNRIHFLDWNELFQFYVAVGLGFERLKLVFRQLYKTPLLQFIAADQLGAINDDVADRANGLITNPRASLPVEHRTVRPLVAL